VPVERCSSCGAVHHEECWEEGDGCAILGCPNAGRARTTSAPVPTAEERAPAPPRRERRSRRSLAAFSALVVGAGTGSLAVALVLSRHDTTVAAPGKGTVTTETPAEAATPAANPSAPPPPPPGGVPAVYAGRFASVDRLERCLATARTVTCGAGPSGKVVRLESGRVTYVGHGKPVDRGGPAMPEGTSFTTPGGRITCSSSNRGISCEDRVSGASFVIGDYHVRVANPRAAATRSTGSRYAGPFASVDRLQRCTAGDAAVVCTSGPSGEGVRLVAGAGVTRLGRVGSVDHGGPAMAEGTSFTTPSGSIRCESSSRGITCTDLTGSGASFTIGDVHIVTSTGGEGGAVRAFASVDRLERCRATATSVSCVAAPSQKEAMLQVGVGASYAGLGDTTDRGGPALRFGASVAVAGGAIRCVSSERGITCRSASDDASFVIGDRRVVVVNGKHAETY